MIDSIFQLTNYQSAKKMMDVTHVRQLALTANLANVETPGYKRIDLNPNFHAQLKRAIGDRDLAQIQSFQPKLQVDQTALARNRDGNTVQLETELVNMTQNSLEHSLEARLVTGTIKYLKTAITGRPA
ncbi:MAG: flagellar basal-body rod protein FlgB [Limisphaerales bacterium]|jgi:flagellar basal-body rod protein FlgB